MSNEVAENYTYSLEDLVSPYATESSYDRLYYDIREDWSKESHATAPEYVVGDMVKHAKRLHKQQTEDASTIEDQVIEHFLEQCVQGHAIKVAASIIRHNTGAYYKLEDVQKHYEIPLDMGPAFQRRLLRSSGQYEYDGLKTGLERQKKENPRWERIPDMEAKMLPIGKFISRIDQKNGGAVSAGQLV